MRPGFYKKSVDFICNKEMGHEKWPHLFVLEIFAQQIEREKIGCQWKRKTGHRQKFLVMNGNSHKHMGTK